jgi:hypothetical protein
MEQHQDAEGQSQNKLASVIQLIRSHIVVHGSAPSSSENTIIDYIGKSNEFRQRRSVLGWAWTVPQRGCFLPFDGGLKTAPKGCFRMTLLSCFLASCHVD